MAEQEVEQIHQLPDSEEEEEEDQQPQRVSEKPAEEETVKPAKQDPEEETEEPAVEEVEKPVAVETVKPAEQDPEEEPEEEEPEEPAVEEVEKPMMEEEEEEEAVKPAVEVEEAVKLAVEEVEKPAVEVEEEAVVKPVVEEVLKPAVEEVEKPVVEEVEKPVVEVEKPVVEEVEKPAVEEVEKLVEQKAGKLVELQPSVEKPAEPPAEQQQPVVCENLGAAAAEPKQEEAAAPSPAPGSLSFPFLEEESTKMALRASRTLYILLGLPGAGKSHLAAVIRDRYQDSCAVVSADDHGVKPERYGASADAHKALDEAVASCCASGRVAVVVDDTNHTNERLAQLGELAEEHRYFALFLEPRTPWRRDLDQLPGKTRRGLDKGQIQGLRASLEAACYPLYFGWFLRHSFRDELEGLAKDLLKTLDSLEAFKKHLSDFTAEGEGAVNLEEYFQHEGPVHCTTKFCDYGNADGAKEYAESQVVQQRLGSVTELQLQALFVTPRTLGARVALTPEQLQLWPTDGDGGVGSALPPGSRAHITLGCAQGVEPVQTGLDLLQILQLQQQGQEGVHVEDLELGPLSYYGNGIWVLSLREPRVGPALFSCFHGRKKPEDLRKKKPKCTLL
ncbi:2',3'-cyclic-nucleotide 3'-phosphodiesterase-like [Anguilla anguilla]|uniref:2',3'-cyclic-nucleotide 3'-phosphodiesterase-like n=1 Tax=Anguilla anguilla TaxID=7936 RepID=UPI0015A8E4B9|nr:2',3'-cyclic-nucleotide 3'-phosphodiesterase-like [Anguilla anguilla]XP_035254195.1 2',3'-cyclic-nucleotide 3'-phosphodiesterase-like [Anguilla anguilla]